MPYAKLGAIDTLNLSAGATSDNPCCILTLDNIVELMGDIELTGYKGNSALATLPAVMHPRKNIRVPVYAGTNLTVMTVTAEGELTLPGDYDSLTVYTNGLTFNVCDRYYNDEIGNNFNQGSSPFV